MKLYIKQEVFSGLDHFYVKDEAGNDIYEVKAPKKAVIVGLQLNILDMEGRELAYVDQKMMSLQPTFRVHRNGEQVATISKKFTMLKPQYVVKELGWTIKGDFTAHDYTVSDQRGVVMTISKQWLTWGDTFVLDLQDTAHVLEAMAVVFAIDQVVDSQGNGVEVGGINIGKL